MPRHETTRGAAYVLVETIELSCLCPTPTLQLLAAGTVLPACPSGCPVEQHEITCPDCNTVMAGGAESPLPVALLVEVGGQPLLTKAVWEADDDGGE